MPSPQSILDGLKLAANDALAVAIFWHVVALVGVVALSRGWRPSHRRAGLLMVTPLASAAVVAVAHGNPFNGGVLGALAVALGGWTARLDRTPVQRSALLAPIGAGMIAFGLLYPHFLDGPAALYLIAAPTGIIPCPTLSLVIGFTLLGGGLRSRAWSIGLAVAGLFYGFFGVFRLGVGLDAGLIAGAAVLLLAAAHATFRRQPAEATGVTPAPARLPSRPAGGAAGGR